MLNLVYGFLGFITGTVFLGLFIYGLATIINWLNVNYGFTYEAKKKKLIHDQLEDIFEGYFVSFNIESKLLILSKGILKDSGVIILKNGVENIKNLYFPVSSINCYETQENVIVSFSNKIETIDLNLTYGI